MNIIVKKVKSFCYWIYVYVFADRIIGIYPGIKAKKHRVNLFDYHPELSEGSKYTYKNSRWNLGDSLGYVVTSYMLEKRGLSLNNWVEKRRHFGCIGSYVFTSFQHLTIWGGGLLCKPDLFKSWFLRLKMFRYPFSKYDFRAVRGPLTREQVLKYGHKCPKVYGDPAILMPFIYTPQCEVTHELLVIPQFYTEAVFREKHPDLYMVSMNTNDYKSVIDAIASSKKVITSSLHGIILAEAYGVPAVFFRGLGKREDFKYMDYYYSTNRFDVKIAESFEDALVMEPLPLPDLKPLQDGLINTFPYDLWEEQ